MKNLTFILLLSLLPQAGLWAQCQDTVKLYLNYTYDGPDIVVDIQVENFQEILGFQFGLNYDNEVIKYESVSSPISSFDESALSVIEQGNIKFLWLSPSSTIGESLPDFSTLIQLRFSALQASSTSYLEISETNLPVEFINEAAFELCVKGSSTTLVTSSGKIFGKVTHDLNKNCDPELSDPILNKWVIELSSSTKTYYRATNEDGEYSFGLPAGEYTIRLIPKNELWKVCFDEFDILLTEESEVLQNFSAHAIVDCPLIKTDISTPFLRRCFDNTYTLFYENQGTIVAENAYIEVDLDDDFDFISTDFTNYTITGQQLRFDLGNLAVNESGYIKIVLNLNCATTILGQTHCVTTTAFPNEPCIVPPTWSGSELSITSECDELNDKVIFTILNTGTGAMKEAKRYIVTEDDVMRPPTNIQLDILQAETLELPADGTSYRIITSQDTDYPLGKLATLAIEGCGDDGSGQFSTGFVTLFEEADRDLFIDTDCKESIGSFDPNDIIGMPKGYGTKQYIEKEVNVEYLIRFQNTGTDTAFTVRIKNYIPESLDLATIQMGAASHEYTYQFNQDRELIITFDDILLVDSTENEAASHGFVKYKILPSSTLIDEDRIENQAKIYFDYNEPITTNEAFHTIGRDFILESIDWMGEKINVTFYPNPTDQELKIDTEDYDFEKIEYMIKNQIGQNQLSGIISDKNANIPCGELPSGVYIMNVKFDHKSQAVLKFIKM
ncbi:MAG TPA: T9SS type A sorting domain-containing protein [Saprospiraceae bacterium]|nr:T9SS type A sorting domain-containing protein [Saprospiraceae bacterium]